MYVHPGTMYTIRVNHALSFSFDTVYPDYAIATKFDLMTRNPWAKTFFMVNTCLFYTFEHIFLVY